MKLLINTELAMVAAGDGAAVYSDRNYYDYDAGATATSQEMVPAPVYTKEEVENVATSGFLFGSILGCILGSAGIFG